MPRKPAPDTRERILTAADHLFYTQGVHAVGVQQVIEECGCGKNLLYREFPSKDDLVVAYLEQRQEEWWASVQATIEPFASDPVQQLLAMVRKVVDDVADPDYLGCPFNRANAEYSSPDHPVHLQAVAQRKTQLELIREIAKRTGVSDPDALAARLVLIMDGAGSNGAMLGAEGPAAIAVALAEDVINHALQRSHPA
jgi:AcrR family transcriptional regulator